MWKFLLVAFLSVCAFVIGASVSTPWAHEAQAADNCAAIGGVMYSKRLVKTFGGAGYPAACKMVSCKKPGTTATKTQLSGSVPPVLMVVFQYQVQFGVAPSNACTSEIQSSTWVTP